MKNNKFLFILFFSLVGLISLQIPFSRMLGSNVKFTLFDFFAPTAGVFLSTIPGIISVFLMQALNLLLHGGNFDIGGIIRLFPTLFAVSYFTKQRKLNFVVPILAMIAFNLHPIGRSAWQYSLFWLIPVVAYFFRQNLIVRSLGATFSAHAVGGALWVWTFGLTKEIWLSLIPQVMIERFLMASGISIFYIFAVNLLSLVAKKKLFFLPFKLEKKYSFV